MPPTPNVAESLQVFSSPTRPAYSRDPHSMCIATPYPPWNVRWFAGNSSASLAPPTVHWIAREPTLGVQALLAVHQHVHSRKTSGWGQPDSWYSFGLWGSPWSWAFSDLVDSLTWDRRAQLTRSSSRTRLPGLPVDYPVYMKPHLRLGWAKLCK